VVWRFYGPLQLLLGPLSRRLHHHLLDSRWDQQRTVVHVDYDNVVVRVQEDGHDDDDDDNNGNDNEGR